MERDLLPGSVVFPLFARGNCFKLKDVAEFHCSEKETTVSAGWERPRHPLPGEMRATGSGFPRLGSSQKSSGSGFSAAPALKPAGAGQATELAASSHEMAAGACSWLSRPGAPQRCLQAQRCPCPAPQSRLLWQGAHNAPAWSPARDTPTPLVRQGRGQEQPLTGLSDTCPSSHNVPAQDLVPCTQSRYRIRAVNDQHWCPETWCWTPLE